MAEVTVYVPDEKILDYVKNKFGLAPGETGLPIEVSVKAQPPVENSVVSHVVTVTIQYGLELGEMAKIADL